MIIHPSFYFAASFSRKAVAKQIAALLRPLRCNSRWFDLESKGYEDGGRLPSMYAQIDSEDVRRSDFLVCLCGDTESRGGRHTELGLAIAWHKPIFLLGEPEQVFHSHPSVRVCKDFLTLRRSLCAELLALPHFDVDDMQASQILYDYHGIISG